MLRAYAQWRRVAHLRQVACDEPNEQQRREHIRQCIVFLAQVISSDTNAETDTDDDAAAGLGPEHR